MIPVKEVLEKRYSTFRNEIRKFAKQDIDTNDEDYNMGRQEVLHNSRFSLLDPLVDYYVTCNNLKMPETSDII